MLPQFLFVSILLVLSRLSLSLPTWSRDNEGDIRSLQGLTRLTHDRSGKRGDPAGKYFHESTFHSHYDGRFADAPLPDEERQTHLSALLHTYLSTMHSIGVETWIMHGSLLGWWWNREIMPWDTDVDVQLTEPSIDFLASYYNMTVHHFNIPAVPGIEVEEIQGRNYLLEINPHYRDGSTDDYLNVIDARWIDMSTGLFIDITALRQNRAAGHALDGHMMCKDKHTYLAKDIFPLRDSVFEGAPVKVPYAYQALLEEEYGKEALTDTEFESHVFQQQTMQWTPKYRRPGHS